VDLRIDDLRQSTDPDKSRLPTANSVVNMDMPCVSVCERSLTVQKRVDTE